MESLSETLWDVVICGTGLQQSLLALALSRSDKKILHIDPNDFYGGPEAALSLQDAEAWAEKYRAPPAPSGDANPPRPSAPPSPLIFASATIVKPSHGAGLSLPRAYSLALAPQIIHARSRLVDQLVSSRAFRQLEFLAVGSFFVLSRPHPAADHINLARIPSTREDVFSDGSIPARAKRSLMKFLKFVLDYNSPPQAELWQAEPDEPLVTFLDTKFKLDPGLCAYVLALTLAPDATCVTTKDGLAIIHRHLTSMGYFGPGFAAVYPKWGGASEIAQVACRSGAVGGAVYMLGTAIAKMKPDEAGEVLHIELSEETTVRTKLLVCGPEDAASSAKAASSKQGQAASRADLTRLIAIVNSPLSFLFEAAVEGAPTAAVAVVACTPRALDGIQGIELQEYSIHIMVHSSDTGECPSGQSVLYLSTKSTPQSQTLLQQSLDPILAALGRAGGLDPPPSCLWQLSYEQSNPATSTTVDGSIVTLPGPGLSLAYNDEMLEPVFEAWKVVMGNAADQDGYMKFADREGMGDNDDDV